MELTHPLDAALRARLKHDPPTTQAEFAKSLGRSAGWLNKYMNGTGNATIDDVVRIVALLIGVETKPLTTDERKLLKAFRTFEAEDDRQDALAYLELRAKRLVARRGPSKESSEPAARTPPATSRKAPGKRKAVGG